MPKLRNLHKILDPEIRAKNLRELRYQLRGLWWDMSRPAVPDPVFVVGCSRSGTTITYETLGAAPPFLKFGWEIPQFWDGLYGPLNNGWQSEAAGAGQAKPEHRHAALRYFYQRLGAGWVLDKTCINVMRIPYLHALFPEAKFVFIQRDGRDNVSSMMDGWRMGRVDGRFELTQFFGPFPEPVAISPGAPHGSAVCEGGMNCKGQRRSIDCWVRTLLWPALGTGMGALYTEEAQGTQSLYCEFLHDRGI